jgi:Transglutaminase-like superfamily
LQRGDFAVLYQKVRDYPRATGAASAEWIQQVCHAMDVACLWYPKPVLCLQRSAATTCMLRSYCVPAQMVIGVQNLPFQAHAWVEVNGGVANDKSYVREMYTVLDCC